jgi:hypothetical protein
MRKLLAKMIGDLFSVTSQEHLAHLAGELVARELFYENSVVLWLLSFAGSALSQVSRVVTLPWVLGSVEEC